ncbi:hypothetical protein PN36_18065 [Candidatus Thiomargarita nelsonii]|uniref:Uncharacterized protein n=1 Tax=Candidatus Thiomargarita nelsonii TaxID=1003181 RepID=A0A0A6PKP7_9GAMM|nr:hypothetical protein PN36_18065 [Candidatus Thiomargarita nelsonii]
MKNQDDVIVIYLGLLLYSIHEAIMKMIVQQQDAEMKKQIYLRRINQLYTKIRNWLQDEPLILENGNIEVVEALGLYQAPRLSIKTQEGEPLADFKPTGASVLLAEGAMDIQGRVGLEYVLYMLENDPQTYFKIETDGWYWQEQREDVEPHFLNNKATLLELITWVSDYEF